MARLAAEKEGKKERVAGMVDLDEPERKNERRWVAWLAVEKEGKKEMVASMVDGLDPKPKKEVNSRAGREEGNGG